MPPVDAQHCAAPEGAEGREHEADGILQGVLGDAPKRRVRDRPRRDDQDAGSDGAERGDQDPVGLHTRGAVLAVVGLHPEGDDDERDLEPFEQHTLEGGGDAEGVGLLEGCSPRVQRGHLLLVHVLFVV